MLKTFILMFILLIIFSGCRTSFFDLIEEKDSTGLKEQLDSKKDEINLIDNTSGLTPLIFAVKNNYFDGIELLLENGADANKTSLQGESPLTLALRNKDTNSLKILLKFGADANKMSLQGESPLALALRNEDTTSLKFLIKFGANPNLIYNFEPPFKNLSGTVLSDALYRKKTNIAQLLIKNGADVNLQDSEGNIPISIALKNDLDINLLWEITKKSDKINDYIIFLREYPLTLYTVKAFKKYRELKEYPVWEQTKRVNSIESYENFLIKYPGSKFTKDARKQLEKIGQDPIMTATSAAVMKKWLLLNKSDVKNYYPIIILPVLTDDDDSKIVFKNKERMYIEVSGGGKEKQLPPDYENLRLRYSEPYQACVFFIGQKAANNSNTDIIDSFSGMWSELTNIASDTSMMFFVLYSPTILDRHSSSIVTFKDLLRIAKFERESDLIRSVNEYPISIQCPDEDIENLFKVLYKQELGEQNVWETFLKPIPGNKWEHEIEFALSIQEGRKIDDLIEKNIIEEKETIQRGTFQCNVEIKRLVPYPVTVNIPIGTHLIRHNKITTEPFVIKLNSDKWVYEDIKAVNMYLQGSKKRGAVEKNPKRSSIPNIQCISEESKLVKVLRLIYQDQFNGDPDLPSKSKSVKTYGYANQAAAWILNDNATYSDLDVYVTVLKVQIPGTSGYGESSRWQTVNAEAAAWAMRFCQETGINIKNKAIWKDRKWILKELEKDINEKTKKGYGLGYTPEIHQWLQKLIESDSSNK